MVKTVGDRQETKNKFTCLETNAILKDETDTSNKGANFTVPKTGCYSSLSTNPGVWEVDQEALEKETLPMRQAMKPLPINSQKVHNVIKQKVFNRKQELKTIALGGQKPKWKKLGGKKLLDTGQKR